jgi:hypothetical protein
MRTLIILFLFFGALYYVTQTINLIFCYTG